MRHRADPVVAHAGQERLAARALRGSCARAAGARRRSGRRRCRRRRCGSPAAAAIAARRWVVVVLPLVPVTPRQRMACDGCRGGATAAGPSARRTFGDLRLGHRRGRGAARRAARPRRPPRRPGAWSWPSLFAPTMHAKHASGGDVSAVVRERARTSTVASPSTSSTSTSARSSCSCTRAVLVAVPGTGSGYRAGRGGRRGGRGGHPLDGERELHDPGEDGRGDVAAVHRRLSARRGPRWRPGVAHRRARSRRSRRRSCTADACTAACGRYRSCRRRRSRGSAPRRQSRRRRRRPASGGPRWPRWPGARGWLAAAGRSWRCPAAVDGRLDEAAACARRRRPRSSCTR